MDHDPLPSRSTVIARSVRLQGIPILRAVLGARMSHLGSFASVGPRIADIRTTPINGYRRIGPAVWCQSRKWHHGTNLVRLSSSSDGFADRRLQAKSGRTDSHERAAAEPLRVSPFENLVGYLGVAGMAEEWWSTISQRSPFLT